MSQYVINAGLKFNVDSASVAPAVKALNDQLKLSKVNIPVNLTVVKSTQNQIQSQITKINQLSTAFTQLATSSKAASGNLKELTVELARVGGALTLATSGTNRIKSTANALSKMAAGTREVAESSDKGSRAMTSFGASVGLATKRFTSFVIAASGITTIAYKFVEATKEALDFNFQMVRLKQVGGDSQDTLDSISKAVTRLSTSLGVSSKDLIQSAVTLRQAGLSAYETKVALDVLAKTQLAPTFKDINNTTEGLIATIGIFEQGVGALERQFSSINTVAAKYAVESSDLIDVIRRSGAAFKAAGGDFDELIGAFTAVRSTTREASESIAAGFRTIFARLERGDTISRLKGLGIELEKIPGQFVGPIEAVKELYKVLGQEPAGSLKLAAVVEEVGGIRQFEKLIPLIQKLPLALEAIQVSRGAGNSLGADAITAQQSLVNQLTKTKEAFLELFRVFSESKTVLAIFTQLNSLLQGTIAAVKTLEPILTPLLIGLSLKAVIGAPRQFSEFRRGLSGSVGGGSLTGRAKGGAIAASDTVPAMLTPGEFVIRKEAAEKIGYGNLHDLNGMSSGGLVPNFKKFIRKGISGAGHIYNDFNKSASGQLYNQQAYNSPFGLGHAAVGYGAEKVLKKVKGFAGGGDVYGFADETEEAFNRRNLPSRYQAQQRIRAVAGYRMGPSKGRPTSTIEPGPGGIVYPNSGSGYRVGRNVNEPHSGYLAGMSQAIRNPATYPIDYQGVARGINLPIVNPHFDMGLRQLGGPQSMRALPAPHPGTWNREPMRALPAPGIPLDYAHNPIPMGNESNFPSNLPAVPGTGLARRTPRSTYRVRSGAPKTSNFGFGNVVNPNYDEYHTIAGEFHQDIGGFGYDLGFGPNKRNKRAYDKAFNAPIEEAYGHFGGMENTTQPFIGPKNGNFFQRQIARSPIAQRFRGGFGGRSGGIPAGAAGGGVPSATGGRGFGGAGYAALIGAELLPSLSDRVLGNAKDPKYGVAGARAGSVLSSAVAGGATGGLLGSSFGPVGTGVGAIGGALIGAVGALKSFEEELNNVKLEKFNDQINKSLEGFNNLTGKFKDKKKEQEFNEGVIGLGKRPEDDWTEEERGAARRRGHVANFFKNIGGPLNPFSDDAYGQSKEENKAESERTKSVRELLEKKIRDVAQANAGQSSDYVLKKTEDFRNKLSKTGPEGFSTALEIKKEIEVRAKLDNMISKNTKMISSMADVVEEMGTRFEHAAEMFEKGQDSIGLAGRSIGGEVVASKNTPLLESLGGAYSTLGGFGKTGGGYDQARSALITSIKRAAEAQANGNIGEGTEGTFLSNVFGANYGGAFGDQIKGGIHNVISKEKLNFGVAAENPGAVADKILAESGVNEINARAKKMQGELDKVWGGFLHKLAELGNRELDLRKKENELIDRGVQTRQAEIVRVGQIRDIIGGNPNTITRTQIGGFNPVNAREEFFGGRFARQINRNRAARNPGVFNFQFQDQQEQDILQQHRVAADALNKKVGGKTENQIFEKMQEAVVGLDKAEMNRDAKAVTEFSQKLAKASHELEDLANSTHDVDAAQALFNLRTNKLQGEVEGRRGVSERLTFGSDEDRMREFQKQQLVQQAAMMNSQQFNMLPEEIRRIVGEGLNETLGVVRDVPRLNRNQDRVVGWNRESGQQIKDRLMGVGNNLAGLNGQQVNRAQERATAASNFLAEAMRIQTAKQQKIIDMQKANLTDERVKNQQVLDNFNKGFRENVQMQINGLKDFNASSNQLALVLAKNPIPNKIELVQNGKVELLINGANTFAFLIKNAKGEIIDEMIKILPGVIEKELKKQKAH